MWLLYIRYDNENLFTIDRMRRVNSLPYDRQAVEARKEFDTTVENATNDTKAIYLIRDETTWRHWTRQEN